MGSNLPNTESVSVIRRTGSAPHADTSIGTSNVFNDDRLTKHALHPLGQKASDCVGRPAWWKRHDDGYGPCRIRALSTGPTRPGVRRRLPQDVGRFGVSCGAPTA